MPALTDQISDLEVHSCAARPKQQGPTYLLRFDDICPTMDWKIWDKIEPVLLERRVKPIVAVVPDNRDPVLAMGPPAKNFWERVRQWQSWGWSIGLHGYQHRYVNTNGGLLKLPKKSEFAGVSRREQEEKLRAGLEIFKAEGIHADAWVAPWHSFDETTVQLLPELGIRIISDGFTLFPFDWQKGVTWVPQQLWSLQPRTKGVWTVCLHSNEWNQARCERFSLELERFGPNIGSLERVVSCWRGRTLDGRDWLNQALIKSRLRWSATYSKFREILAF